MQASVIDLRGHNSAPFGMEETRPKKPPKLSPEQEIEFAKTAEAAAKLLAARFSVAKKRIITKRKGDEALAVRRALFRYMKGLGCPMKLMARIFDLERCAPGADADAMEQWEARNPEIDADMENIVDGLDRFLAVEPKAFIERCESELEADRAAANAVKAAKKATALLEAGNAKAPMSEAERLVAEGQAKRAAAKRSAEIEIHMAVIRKGAEPGASKEAKRDALKAADAIELLMGKPKKTKRA